MDLNESNKVVHARLSAINGHYTKDTRLLQPIHFPKTILNGGPYNFELLTNSAQTERRERIGGFGRKSGLLGLLTDGETSLFGRV